MKIFLIYIITGWAISMLNTGIALYKDAKNNSNSYDLNDIDNMINNLFMIAYWLPMLFTLGVSYAVKGIQWLISYIKKTE